MLGPRDSTVLTTDEKSSAFCLHRTHNLVDYWFVVVVVVVDILYYSVRTSEK